MQKTRYVKKQSERIIFKDITSTALVYRWTYQLGDRKPVDYIVTAASVADAKKTIKDRIARRLTAYKGLARRALGALMHKTANTSIVDTVNQLCAKTADEQTHVKTTVSGGIHTMFLEDDLNYAIDALKGGRQAVDLAVKKASNKITSTINRRCKNLLDFKPLPLPFPEVKSRKN